MNTKFKRIPELQHKKGKEGISMLTAYDYPTACMLDEAGIDIVLVGDSLGNVILGLPDTLSVTMADMIHHGRAVSRGIRQACLIIDMPFGSYQVSKKQAVQNACELMAKTHAHGVKLEGGELMASHIEAMVNVGIPVMAHVGLMPQSVHQIGGYRSLGKNSDEAKQIMKDAKAVQKAGAFSVVLECVDADLAKAITQELSIPTIGIGSGKHCDGQVLVTHDLLGYTTDYVPKFVAPKANLKTIVMQALQDFISEVKGQADVVD